MANAFLNIILIEISIQILTNPYKKGRTITFSATYINNGLNNKTPQYPIKSQKLIIMK